MKILGVILARAGSVGLPGKHLLNLAGRPVVAHSIGHACEAELLTHRVISTDCPTCGRLARSQGIEHVDRPAHLAHGEASVQDVLLHAMDELESRGGDRFDAVVTIYGNVPLRPAGLIDRAVRMWMETACDSVRSFCPVGKWHPQWMSRLDQAGRVEGSTGGVHRRQDLEPLYLHDGGVVVSGRAAMEMGRADRGNPHAFFGVDRRGVKTEMGEVVEVDHLRDLLLAEAILGEQRARRGAA